MRRKRAAVGAALIGASATRHLIPFIIVGFVGRDGLLDILKREGELVRIELLGTLTKLHALQLTQEMQQAIVSRQRFIARRDSGVTLGKRRSKPRLQLGDIG